MAPEYSLSSLDKVTFSWHIIPLIRTFPTWYGEIHSMMYIFMHNKCKKLKQFKTQCNDDMVNSDN